ncbi:gamma-glutamyl-gamma-aminobutyrate hydrolase family protein [Desulfofalx alkaliphila]|uniref:gamma-glutamyl-gamma-aminobutyrate hydrolase family protein n=1 Tax=Desulfofalx alkaliphila TaxID=105483 RepID=UPI0004E1E187|nr:gamma-glutamyl-gamma-aminobutyrate hydrolase family protein [Desulfofalx alkaliphila]
MLKPIIGISCCYDEPLGRLWLNKPYVEAVMAAGGIAVVLPVLNKSSDIDDMLEFCRAVILPGGGDIDPLLFGEEPQAANGEICPYRDGFELELARRAMDRNIPLLGICRGMQVLNVAAGGTVCQDITNQIKNPIKHFQQAPRWYPTHTLTPVEGTRLEKIIGRAPVKVNSYHHQMIGKIGDRFKISAYAPDGVVEAIEDQDNNKFIVGVQYHPETMWKTDAKALALFESLVESARVARK